MLIKLINANHAMGKIKKNLNKNNYYEVIENKAYTNAYTHTTKKDEDEEEKPIININKFNKMMKKFYIEKTTFKK